MILLRSFLFALSGAGFLALAGAAWAGPVEEAEDLLRAGQVSVALDTVRSHVANVPGDIAAHELLIDTLVSTGRGGNALTHYRTRTEERPQDADAWYLRGRAEPRPTDARAAYEVALQLAPAHARAWMGLGAVRRGLGDHRGAEEAYGRAVSLDASLAEAWTGRWTLRVAAGDEAGARELARAATNVVPTDPEAWLALAALEPGNAVAHLSAGMAHAPLDTRLQASLARACFEGGDLKGAARAYSVALEQQPFRADLRAEGALVAEIQADLLSMESARSLLSLRELTDREAALALAESITATHPASGRALLIRGNLRHGLGDRSGAEADLRAAVDRMGGDVDARAALGLLLLNTGRAAEAMAHLQAALSAHPWDDGMAVATATAQAGTGDLEGALIALQAAQLRFPDRAGPAIALAQLRLAMGQGPAALEGLAQSLARNPAQELVAAFLGIAGTGGLEARAVALLNELTEATGDPRFADAGAVLVAMP